MLERLAASIGSESAIRMRNSAAVGHIMWSKSLHILCTGRANWNSEDLYLALEEVAPEEVVPVQ